MFIPAWVGETLTELPTVASLLGDPVAEGESARHFPEARTTPRQIYRLLAAPHIPHVVDLLRRVEFVCAHGWRDDQLFATGSRAQMRGGIAEVLFVETLLLGGFQIEPVERGSGRSPDISATHGDLHALVEVYAPRTWEGLFDFIEDAKDWLLHLDEPYDYDFNFDMRHFRLFNERGFARWFDAFEFSLSAQQQRERVLRLAPVLTEAQRRLASGVPNVEIERDDDELDIQVTLSLSSIRMAEHELPARCGVLSPPALSGYRPERIFENMLAKGLRKKLERRQAIAEGAAAVLVVDISHLQIETELDHSTYQSKFGETLVRRIDRATMAYDLVLFVMPSQKQGQKPAVIFEIARDGSSIADAVLDVIHPSRPLADLGSRSVGETRHEKEVR